MRRVVVTFSGAADGHNTKTRIFDDLLLIVSSRRRCCCSLCLVAFLCARYYGEKTTRVYRSGSPHLVRNECMYVYTVYIKKSRLGKIYVYVGLRLRDSKLHRHCVLRVENLAAARDDEQRASAIRKKVQAALGRYRTG